MKRLLIISIAVAFVVSVLGLSYSEAEPPSENLYTVPDPTGIPEIDWDNIQYALDNYAAEGWDGIQLQANLLDGTHYKIHKMLFIEGFRGTFKGAGKDLTTIEAVRASNGDAFEVGYNDYWGVTWSMIEFVYPQDEVNISDLALEVNIPDPLDPWEFYYYPYFMTTCFDGFLSIIGGDFNSTIENVRFKGGPGDFYGRNSKACIYLMGGPAFAAGPGVGNSTIKGCDFEGIPWLSALFQFWEDSTIIASNNMIVTDMGYGFVATSISNCNVEISRNEIEIAPSPYDIPHDAIAVYNPGWWAFQGQSNVLIQKNKITVGGNNNAIWLGGPGGQTLGALVIGNDIRLKDVDLGGILLWKNINNAVIANNKIAGTSGIGGINLGIWDGPSNNCVLQANNMNNLSTQMEGGAKIWLGPWASECTVVGGGPNTNNVFDQGTDNILVGVNNIHGNPPGPEISEAMQRKREIMEEMK